MAPIGEGLFTLHAAELLPPLCFVAMRIWQFVALETDTACLFVVLRCRIKVSTKQYAQICKVNIMRGNGEWVTDDLSNIICCHE